MHGKRALLFVLPFPLVDVLRHTNQMDGTGSPSLGSVPCIWLATMASTAIIGSQLLVVLINYMRCWAGKNIAGDARIVDSFT